MSQYAYKIATHIQTCLAQYSCGFEPVRVQGEHTCLDREWVQSWAQSVDAGTPREESRNSDGYGRLATHDTARAAKVRRHEGRVFTAALEFKHEITPAELRSGLAVIDLNAYKELVIRVRDAGQRPLANSIIF
jgi:hypothetical protein